MHPAGERGGIYPRVVQIDPEDEELVRSLGPWRRSYRGYLTDVYNSRPGGTVQLRDLIKGASADEEVWPLNGDGLDCRKSNLRIRKKPKN